MVLRCLSQMSEDQGAACVAKVFEDVLSEGHVLVKL